CGRNDKEKAADRANGKHPHQDPEQQFEHESRPEQPKVLAFYRTHKFVAGGRKLDEWRKPAVKAGASTDRAGAFNSIGRWDPQLSASADSGTYEWLEVNALLRSPHRAWASSRDFLASSRPGLLR